MEQSGEFDIINNVNNYQELCVVHVDGIQWCIPQYSAIVYRCTKYLALLYSLTSYS